jgi:hypothetical protein
MFFETQHVFRARSETEIENNDLRSCLTYCLAILTSLANPSQNCVLEVVMRSRIFPALYVCVSAIATIGWLWILFKGAAWVIG